MYIYYIVIYYIFNCVLLSKVSNGVCQEVMLFFSFNMIPFDNVLLLIVCTFPAIYSESTSFFILSKNL